MELSLKLIYFHRQTKTIGANQKLLAQIIFYNSDIPHRDPHRIECPFEWSSEWKPSTLPKIYHGPPTAAFRFATAVCNMASQMVWKNRTVPENPDGHLDKLRSATIYECLFSTIYIFLFFSSLGGKDTLDFGWFCKISGIA